MTQQNSYLTAMKQQHIIDPEEKQWDLFVCLREGDSIEVFIHRMESSYTDAAVMFQHMLNGNKIINRIRSRKLAA
jgi:hypothetical protein